MNKIKNTLLATAVLGMVAPALVSAQDDFSLTERKEN